MKAHASTDVNTPEQKAGISLNKTHVCCKLENVVKVRFHSASPHCPVSKWYLLDTSSLPHTMIGQGCQG